MQYRFWKETRVALLQNSPGQLSWLWIGCASPTCLGMFVEFHALNAFHASGLIPWIAVGGAFVVVDIDVEVVVLLVDVAVWHLSWFSRGILTGWQYWESVFPWNTTISNRNRKSFLHELKHPWAPSPCLVSCDSKIQLYSHHLRWFNLPSKTQRIRFFVWSSPKTVVSVLFGATGIVPVFQSKSSFNGPIHKLSRQLFTSW